MNEQEVRAFLAKNPPVRDTRPCPRCGIPWSEHPAMPKHVGVPGPLSVPAEEVQAHESAT